MKRMLDEFIYDRQTGMICTFSRPKDNKDYLDIVTLALDILDEKRIIESKNIKSFYLMDFQIIFCSNEGLKYIQKLPEKGREPSIIG